MLGTIKLVLSKLIMSDLQVLASNFASNFAGNVKKRRGGKKSSNTATSEVLILLTSRIM